MSHQDGSEYLAPGDGEWHVTQCACGHITLRLGTLRGLFTRKEVADLHSLLHEAMLEFGIEPSSREIARVRPTRH